MSKLVEFNLFFYLKFVYKNLSHQLIYVQKLECRDLAPELNFTRHLNLYFGKIIPQTPKYSVICVNKG